MRVDLHSHTSYSPDGIIPPADLVERAREIGLDRIAVTDHGRIDGALAAHALDPELVIVGEEVRCRCRTELIGLFLTHRIPQGLPLAEVAARIHDQGGVIYAPHPYAYAVLPSWHARRSLQVADMIETWNSRAFLPAWNRRAIAAAGRRALPAGAGSDAHFLAELGRAWTEMPEFKADDPVGFRAKFDQARAVAGERGSPFLHVAGLGVRCARILRPGWFAAPLTEARRSRDLRKSYSGF